MNMPPQNFSIDQTFPKLFLELRPIVDSVILVLKKGFLVFL